MTQAEKLEALVREAMTDGFKGPIPLSSLDHPPVQYTFIRSEGLVEVLTPAQRWLFGVFNHDFARALFGDGYTFDIDALPGGQVAWQYHLQQAVISHDPINYMYKAVFSDE